MPKLIKVNGEVSIVQPKNGTDFQLKEMYELLSCDTIDIIHLSTGELMVLDDEGKLTDGWEQRINISATRLYKTGRMTRLERERYFQRLKAEGTTIIESDLDPSDSIVGDVLVCEPKFIK